MEILDGSALDELIFRRYARNPNGWFFTISPSKSHGFYDALVGNAELSWQLKLDTIFKPSPLVIGAESEAGIGRFAAPVPLSFGYREMNPSSVGSLEGGAEAIPRLAELLRSLSPVVPEVGKAYARGPFVLTRGSPQVRDSAQAKIDERLSSDMLRLVRSRYPSYG